MHKKPLGQVSWTIQGFQRISCSGYKLGGIDCCWEWDGHQSMGGEQTMVSTPFFWDLLSLITIVIIIVVVINIVSILLCFQLSNGSYLNPWVLWIFFSWFSSPSFCGDERWPDYTPLPPQLSDAVGSPALCGRKWSIFSLEHAFLAPLSYILCSSAM